MRSRQRIIVIVWKWAAHNLQNEGKWYIGQKETDSDVLYCLSENSGFQAYNEEILSILQHHSPNADAMVFFHRKSLPQQIDFPGLLLKYKSILCENALASCNIKLFDFGSGEDFLYLANNDDGLLGVNGEFPSRKYWINAETGEQKCVDIDFFVDKKAQVLRSNAFNKMWDHYFYSVKKKTMILREELLRHFLNFTTDKDPKDALVFYDQLQAAEPLKLKVKSFMNKKVSLPPGAKNGNGLFNNGEGYFKATYGEDAENAYQQLKDQLDVLLNPPFDPVVPYELFRGIRDGFDDLLNLITDYADYTDRVGATLQ